MPEPDSPATPSTPATPPTSPTPADAAGGDISGGVLSALGGALAGVAGNLKDPALLAGFGFGALVVVTALVNRAAFLVGLLLFGLYLVALLASFVFQRWGNSRAGDGSAPTAGGAGDDPGADVRRMAVRRSRRVRVPGFGEWRGRSRVAVDRSEDVVIGGTGTLPEPVVPSLPTPTTNAGADAATNTVTNTGANTGADTGAATDGTADGTAADRPLNAPRQPYTPTLLRARDTVLAAARAESGRGGVPFEIVADSGCGKTLLLEEIAAELKRDGRLVLFITAGAPQYGDGRTMAVAEQEIADYAACRQIVDAIAADVHRAYDPDAGEQPLLDPRHGRELEAAILAAREGRRTDPPGATQVTIDISRSSDVRIGDLAGAVPPASRLAEMQRQVTRLLDAEARSRPVALLVDDVHTVAGTRVEDWLMAVLRGLSTAVVVLGGRPAARGALVPGGRQIRLGLLSPDETRAFVRDRLVGAGWQEPAAAAAAAEVAALTRGHPIGMATCTTIVCDSLPPDTPARQVRALLLGGAEHWDDDDAFEAVRTYVDDHAAALTGRRVPLFDLLVILRRCTPEILTALLAEEEGVAGRQAAELYDWLARCAFVTPFDDDADEGWRLHDYLRENLERRFRRTRPAEYARLHAAVERHYRARMNFDEERDEQSVMALGARYEDPDWQRDSQEWLHHAAHLPRADVEGSTWAMIRLFLEAFYWWDVEVPWSYCDQLVAAYRALPADRDLRWVALLEQLRTGYVPGRINQVPGRDRVRWEQAGEALDGIAEYLHLRRGRVPAAPDLRRIYIVLCQLNAAVVWFAGDATDADRDRAAAWYRASGAACTDESERWMGNWASFEEASLWAATDPARARALLDGLEERIADEDDHELPIWLAQALAEIAWAEGDPRRSFDAHARAALHAFVYHVHQETFGQYPNRYSDSLHRTVLATIERRERLALAAGLTHEVAAAKARCRAFFAPYWRRVGQDPGDGFGLPHPPAAGDLGTDLSAFARTARWAARNMRDELDRPLEDPLPDPSSTP